MTPDPKTLGRGLGSGDLYDLSLFYVFSTDTHLKGYLCKKELLPAMLAQNIEHRLYPIGALPPQDVMNIIGHPLFKDTVTLDLLMQDWQVKSQIFKSLVGPNPTNLLQNIRPLNVSQSVMNKITDVITSYRNYLPPDYELAFVPISALITPQKSVLLERARAFSPNATQPLNDDQVAELCLGRPITVPSIDVKALGTAVNPQNPNQITYVYQFESEDQDIRFFPPPPLETFRTVNFANVNGRLSYDLEAVPFSVGPGTPLVQVLKVQAGFTPIANKGVIPQYKYILNNGIHRVFRLAELGNQYVAALVQEANLEEIPNVLADTPKAALFSQRPLMASDLANMSISRIFDWQKAKSLIKLQITVNAEKTVIL